MSGRTGSSRGGSQRRTWALAGVALVTALAAPPILAVSAPQDVQLPPLVERPLPAPARFSHWFHGAQACYTCHPSLFPQWRQGFTHQDMSEGRFCGACHDGRRAQAITTMRCEGCHVPK